MAIKFVIFSDGAYNTTPESTLLAYGFVVFLKINNIKKIIYYDSQLVKISQDPINYGALIAELTAVNKVLDYLIEKDIKHNEVTLCVDNYDAIFCDNEVVFRHILKTKNKTVINLVNTIKQKKQLFLNITYKNIKRELNLAHAYAQIPVRQYIKTHTQRAVFYDKDKKILKEVL
jgi:hypothetical protein